MPKEVYILFIAVWFIYSKIPCKLFQDSKDDPYFLQAWEKKSRAGFHLFEWD